MDTPTMLETLGTLVTQFMTWMGSVVTTIGQNQLLLIPIAIFCVGAAIGLFGRIFGR